MGIRKRIKKIAEPWGSKFRDEATADSDDKNDICIAVMGATGSGKSTFINQVSGASLHISTGLNSCTQEVKIAPAFQLNDRKVKLYDTPGFDDTGRSNATILKLIAAFLEVQHRNGVKLHGVIYLHRISDNRVGGVSKGSFMLFRRLCGNEALKNVIIVTTMWSEVDKDTGQVREEELKQDDRFFKSYLEGGAKMMRHDNTKKSGHQIISSIFRNHPLPLSIQSELVEQRRTILETEAGQEVHRIFKEKIQKLDMEIQELKSECTSQKEAGAGLEREIQELRGQIYQISEVLKNLPSEYSKELDIWRQKFRSPKLTQVQSPHTTGQGQNVFIAVMGLTGTGKSTFINLVSGGSLIVSDSLSSCTDGVMLSPSFGMDGYNITLVDTPGFDDTEISEVDTLKKISSFLEVQYKGGITLHGVLYFHRITDNRVGGIATRSFRLFRKICGTETLSNVVIVTTMWERSQGEGELREKELKEMHFKSALNEGAKLARHDNGIDSAKNILRNITGNLPKILRIQHELVDEKMDITQTEAGKEVLDEFQNSTKLHEDTLLEIESEIKDGDYKTRHELEMTKCQMQEKFERFAFEVNHLASLYLEDVQQQLVAYAQFHSGGPPSQVVVGYS